MVMDQQSCTVLTWMPTVQEATGLPYASKVRVKLEDGTETPVAHMCGHDAHVTWMLSMAKTLVALKRNGAEPLF
jgi:metal-dependent amidase/aminoacylase/carboxypeptidase family protein